MNEVKMMMVGAILFAIGSGIGFEYGEHVGMSEATFQNAIDRESLIRWILAEPNVRKCERELVEHRELTRYAMANSVTIATAEQCEMVRGRGSAVGGHVP